MLLSSTEENYLKCIYKLAQESDKGVNTNAISAAINTTAASVTDMLKKLRDKGLLDYIKYKGVRLTEEGEGLAVALIRKHRLWEVFLADKLRLRWDEVHDIAEQLEHIQSPLLIQRLDEFLGFPKFDPHGDPIPDQFGNYTARSEMLLADLPIGSAGTIVGVRDHSPLFLNHLGTQGLILGRRLSIIKRLDFDHSIEVETTEGQRLFISDQVASNLFVSTSE